MKNPPWPGARHDARRLRMDWANRVIRANRANRDDSIGRTDPVHANRIILPARAARRVARIGERAANARPSAE
ncbi:hypothetical protein WS62_30640 [Burkholderia sp. ABCPW 14]|nr:hypothetical protein WS62_30640 [Burkholderia sp. ABCPW 14]